MELRLLPLTAVQARLCEGKTRLYRSLHEGIVTPPIRVGNRSAWPAHEIDQLVAARIAGFDPDQQRGLVANLVEQRKSLAPRLA